jgi:hypothetical protein
MRSISESALIAVLWPEYQHLNFGEIRQLAHAAATVIDDTAIELTKKKFAEESVKFVDADTYDRRELDVIGDGPNEFHITLWGASAPKVQLGVRALDALDAQRQALTWARRAWFQDKRDIGIEKIERRAEQVTA